MNKLTIFLLLMIASYNVSGHNVPELMKKCSLEKNALKRLVCFDEISQNLTPSPNEPTPSKQVIVAPVEPPKQLITSTIEPVKEPIETTTPSKEFGLKNKSEPEEGAQSIVANVQAIRTNPFKKYIITLDNGHVWKQFDSTRLRIKVGETVTIKRGVLGTYFMGKDGVNSRLRVKRIK